MRHVHSGCQRAVRDCAVLKIWIREVAVSRDSIQSFLDRLAAGGAAPGGGAANALAAGTAAALLSMACRLTIGRVRFAQHEMMLVTALGDSEELRRRATDLVDGDVAAYGAVSAARALPRSTDDERSRRSARIQGTMVGATEVQVQVGEVAAELLHLGRRITGTVNPNAAADLAVGLLLAEAALAGAVLNVRTNIALITDANLRLPLEDRLRALIARVPSSQPTPDNS